MSLKGSINSVNVHVTALGHRSTFAVRVHENLFVTCDEGTDFLLHWPIHYNLLLHKWSVKKIKAGRITNISDLLYVTTPSQCLVSVWPACDRVIIIGIYRYLIPIAGGEHGRQKRHQILVVVK